MLLPAKSQNGVFSFPFMKKITGLNLCYNNCPWDWLAIILVSLTFQSEMTWTAEHPWTQVTASNYFPSTLDLLYLIVASKSFSKKKMISALTIYLNVLVKVLEHFQWAESRHCLCCLKHIFNLQSNGLVLNILYQPDKALKFFLLILNY